MEGPAKRFKKSDEPELMNRPIENNNNENETIMAEAASASTPHPQENAVLPQESLRDPNDPFNGISTSPKTNGTDYPSDPLSVSKVLATIFRNLSANHLKTLRFVNNQWKSVATGILKEKLEPIVFSEECYDSDKMLKVVQTFKVSKDPPYVKFEIASKFFTEENENLISDFFRICGPFMEYLTICTDKNQDSKFQFAEVLFTTVSLPRLKSLIFEDHTPNGVQVQYNHDFSMLFKALINAASNLERLDLSFPKRFFETDDEETMTQLHQMPDGIICSRSSQNLKHLEISAKITDIQLLCLSKSNLRLSTLHFRVKNVSLLESSFTALLESQSDTLLELKLTEERHGSDFLVKFPRMAKLKKITIISICEFENSIVTFAPFGYQEHLPQMETIILWNCFGKEGRWCQFFMASSPSPTITRLELPTQFRNPGLARNISVVFPALKRLKMGFSLRPENEEVMRIIFETMTNLEELSLYTDMDEMNENIDHVLTGIPKNVCKQIRQDQSYLLPNALDGVERSPSLINMRNLKRLDIVLDNNRAPFITEVTGYLGFMQIPKLRILRFTRYGMSQECVNDLVAKYRVEFIPPRNHFFEVEYLNLDDFQ